MVDDLGDERLDQLEEEEGGPVKSFLEHLEDLRWVLIKSISTLAVAMFVCLLAGNYVVKIIKWPLTRTHVSYPATNQVVTVRLGKQRLGTYQLNPQQQQLFSLGTNQFVG